MKTFTLFFIGLFLIGHISWAQEIDSLEVDQTADVVEEKIEDVQEYLEKKAEFGVKAGFNFSTFNDAQTFNPDSQTGLHLGLFGRYLWGERLSGKAELLYTTLGARADEFYVFDDYSVDLNYLQFILTGEFEVANGFRLELGPYLGVLLSSRQSFGDLDINVAQDGRLRSQCRRYQLCRRRICDWKHLHLPEWIWARPTLPTGLCRRTGLRFFPECFRI